MNEEKWVPIVMEQGGDQDRKLLRENIARFWLNNLMGFLVKAVQHDQISPGGMTRNEEFDQYQKLGILTKST